MVKNNRGKCIICEERPRYNGSRYCHDCDLKIKADRRKPEAKPEYYLNYRGVVVGLFRNGNGRLSPHLLRREVFRKDRYGNIVPSVPESRLINLDNYCPGYTRDQIKAFKSVIAKLMPKFVRN